MGSAGGVGSASAGAGGGIAPAWRWALFAVAAVVALIYGLRFATGRGRSPATRAGGLFLLLIVAAWVAGPAGQLIGVQIPTWLAAAAKLQKGGA